MGDPRTVEAVGRLALLVVTDLRERALGDWGIPPIWDDRRHTAESERAALVAGLHQELGVRAHEGNGHGDLAAVREDELLPIAKLLDDAEHVVPTPRVQPRAVIAKLVERLLHLECERQDLDEHRGLDLPAAEVEILLSPLEDLVPQARLLVTLHLGQIEVGSAPALQQAPR